MKVQVIGSGCQTCKRMYEETKKVIQELRVTAEVEYSTDISKIIELGVMQSPVIVIDGEPVIVGAANKEKIMAALQQIEA